MCYRQVSCHPWGRGSRSVLALLRSCLKPALARCARLPWQAGGAYSSMRHSALPADQPHCVQRSACSPVERMHRCAIVCCAGGPCCLPHPAWRVCEDAQGDVARRLVVSRFEGGRRSCAGEIMTLRKGTWHVGAVARPLGCIWVVRSFHCCCCALPSPRLAPVPRLPHQPRACAIQTACMTPVMGCRPAVRWGRSL